MNKYLFLLVVPLLFFSIGCEKDTIQDTQLDSDLYGIWRSNLGSCDYYIRTFSSNGKWSFSHIDIDYYPEYDCDELPLNYDSHSVGDFWIQDNYIIFEDDGGGGEQSLPYIISGDELILGHSNEQYVYERQ